MKNQKKIYLNEKIKMIKKELGDDIDEDSEDNTEIANLRKKLKKIKISEEGKQKVKEELKRMEGMYSYNPDYHVIRNYVEFVLSLPWGIKTNLDNDLKHAEEILNRDHYGLNEVKAELQRVIETGNTVASQGQYAQEQGDYAKEQATGDFTNYTRKGFKNTIHSGKFSSDRTILNYVEEIWGIKVVKKEEKAEETTEVITEVTTEVTAAVTAARLGYTVDMITESEQLGGLFTEGMLTALDLNYVNGNHILHEGFFTEFYKAASNGHNLDLIKTQEFFDQVIKHKNIKLVKGVTDITPIVR